MLHVKLKPQGATVGRGQHHAGHRLHGHAGLHAQDQAGAQSGGGAGHGPFTVGVGQSLVGHRRQQNRVCQCAPQQQLARMAAAQIAQDTGHQMQVVPCRAVGPQADFIGRAAAALGAGLVRPATSAPFQ